MVIREGDQYPHLSRAARDIAGESIERRIQFVRAERWIGYPRAVEAVARLEELLQWPPRQRMPNLLIVAPTNNGKSMIIERFCRSHRQSSGVSVEHIPVLSIQMPAVPTLGRFYSAILDGLGAPFRPQSRASDLERMAVRVMKATGVRILIIDELHNILAATTPARHDFLNLLRFLGNEVQISLVGVGTSDAYLAIRSDSQLENRFEPFSLPLWQPGKELLALLASFERMLPLRRPSEMVGEEMAQYLLSRSEGTIGELSQLITSAAVSALKSGEESINRASLSAAGYMGPSQRRQQFERKFS